MRANKTRRYIKKLKNDGTEYVVRYKSDAKLRVKISLYIAVFINMIYAILQFGLGLEHNSLWFYSIAAYYFLLVLVRFFLLRDVRGLRPGEDVESEFKRYRFCGIILLIMHEVLVVIVFFMTYFGQSFEHHPLTTALMGVYTVVAMIFAIVNLIKYRKYKSPILSACKTVSLASVSVSVLTLESAVFSSFGEGIPERFKEHMIFFTGAALCVFLMALAISMIVHSTKELKHLKDE